MAVLKTRGLAARRFRLMALDHIEKRARRIRELRGNLGLSQEGLADRMQEVHRERHPDLPPDQTRGQMVSDWERAVNEPSPKKLELLAGALGVTVAELSVDPPDKTMTPDPFAHRISAQPILDRLAIIEHKLDALGMLAHPDGTYTRLLSDLESDAGAGASRDIGELAGRLLDREDKRKLG